MNRYLSNCGLRFGLILLAMVVGLHHARGQQVQPAAFTTPSSAGIAANKVPQYDTIVITAPHLAGTLKRWIDYRSAQGHRLLVVGSRPHAAENRAFVKAAVAMHPTIKNLVLVGDAGDWAYPPAALVPTDHVLAEVNYLFGSEPEIATDNTFADLDGDSMPELTVGRIVALNQEQLNRYIDRVIAYESESVDAAWRRRINLVAGLGGFGSVTDGLIEGTAKQIITDKIPASYATSVTYASWQSPYCPDPRQFSQTAIDRFNDGCMFWIYVGHGDRRQLDKVRVPKQRFDILDYKSAKSMNCQSGSPIAIFLACYTGAIDSSRDCLAEQMIKQPGGPIAVICGSRVTMPYAMSLLSIEMADEFFKGKCETIGQLMRSAKRSMANPLPTDVDDHYRQLIESMGQTLSPLPTQLKAEKREHLHLVNLLGDPLLRLKRPNEIPLQCSDEIVAGERLNVQGTTTTGGTLTIELVYRRDRFRTRLRRRRKFDSSEEKLAAYQKTYDQAHDQVCVIRHGKVAAGSFTASIKVPDDVKGECEVRAMIIGDAEPSAFGLGSRSVNVTGLPKIKMERTAARTSGIK